MCDGHLEKVFDWSGLGGFDIFIRGRRLPAIRSKAAILAALQRARQRRCGGRARVRRVGRRLGFESSL